MTSENASFGQDKETKHKSVSNTHSSFQSEYVSKISSEVPRALRPIFKRIKPISEEVENLLFYAELIEQSNNLEVHPA